MECESNYGVWEGSTEELGGAWLQWSRVEWRLERREHGDCRQAIKGRENQRPAGRRRVHAQGLAINCLAAPTNNHPYETVVESLAKR